MFRRAGRDRVGIARRLLVRRGNRLEALRDHPGVVVRLIGCGESITAELGRRCCSPGSSRPARSRERRRAVHVAGVLSLLLLLPCLIQRLSNADWLIEPSAACRRWPSCAASSPSCRRGTRSSRPPTPGPSCGCCSAGSGGHFAGCSSLHGDVMVGVVRVGLPVEVALDASGRVESDVLLVLVARERIPVEPQRSFRIGPDINDGLVHQSLSGNT